MKIGRELIELDTSAVKKAEMKDDLARETQRREMNAGLGSVELKKKLADDDYVR